jgi:hypothetical protein
VFSVMIIIPYHFCSALCYNNSFISNFDVHSVYENVQFPVESRMNEQWI